MFLGSGVPSGAPHEAGQDHVPHGAERLELPLDARRRGDGDGADDAAVVAAVLDALPSPTLLIDAEGTVMLGNSAWEAAAAVLNDERVSVGIGGNYFEMALRLKDDATNRGMIAALQELSRGERRNVSMDYALPHSAGVLWFHLQATRVGSRGHVVVTHTDVTSRVLAEQTSTWQAQHDHLTGLPNRAHLHELIDAALEGDESAVTVLFLDVDGFKDVNDSLGHDVGDDVLRELAGRLTALTRDEDTVGRLGGDEFVVLCRECEPADADQLARRLRDSFDRPFLLAGRSIRLSASIGISGVGSERAGVRSTDLVRDADLAMYAAKADGRNRVRTFSPGLRTAAEQKVTLATEFREAIETGQLVLHYQPILFLPTGECTGVEALVRWRHPERGLLYPGDFLPTAEQHDLMTPLAQWVLGAASRQTAQWRDAGLALVTGVNINASHFASGTLVEDVMGALEEAGLGPEQLVVELTETSVAHDPGRAAEQFAELRRRGVEVAIDDFGSGFSSLGQLVTIPTGILKIDRSLVAFPEGKRAQTAATIAAIVALGQACGIRSLAEGVETAEQLELAIELGCSFAQGYHIARPMPAGDVAPWMAAHRAALTGSPAGIPA
jgi:diguanylate cyclase (GGDEF)-like protein